MTFGRLPPVIVLPGFTRGMHLVHAAIYIHFYCDTADFICAMSAVIFENVIFKWSLDWKICMNNVIFCEHIVSPNCCSATAKYLTVKTMVLLWLVFILLNIKIKKLSGSFDIT